MGFIIFVAVVILAIYLIKKSSSDKNSSFEEPVKSQISFDNLSPEELNDRDEIFRELMQGRNAEELTKCYTNANLCSFLRKMENLREVFPVCCQRRIVRKSLPTFSMKCTSRKMENWSSS